MIPAVVMIATVEEPWAVLMAAAIDEGQQDAQAGALAEVGGDEVGDAGVPQHLAERAAAAGDDDDRGRREHGLAHPAGGREHLRGEPPGQQERQEYAQQQCDHRLTDEACELRDAALSQRMFREIRDRLQDDQDDGKQDRDDGLERPRGGARPE